MRAGFGMFYVPAMEFGDYQGLSLPGFTQTTPYVGTVDGITPKNLLSDPFPGGLILPPGKARGALTNVGFDTNPAHFRLSESTVQRVSAQAV